MQSSKRLYQKQGWDSVLQMFVARQVFIERLSSRHAWFLEFDHDGRQAVNEPDQIGRQYKDRP